MSSATGAAKDTAVVRKKRSVAIQPPHTSRGTLGSPDMSSNCAAPTYRDSRIISRGPRTWSTIGPRNRSSLVAQRLSIVALHSGFWPDRPHPKTIRILS
jgi:hypothetical protein